MKKQISMRVTAVLLTICIVGMMTISTVDTLVTWSSLKEKTLDNIDQETAREAERINGWLEHQIAYITALSASCGHRELTAEALLPVLQDHMNAVEYYFDVVFGFTDGKVVMSSGFEPDYASGWSCTDRPWYIGALANPDKAFVTQPYIAVQTGELCVTLSKAVVQNGKIVGVVAVDMHINEPISVVNATNVGEGSYAFLTDKDGYILLPTNVSYNFDDATRYFSQASVTATDWKLCTSIAYSVIYSPLYRVIFIAVLTCVLLALIAARLIYKIMTKLISGVRVITAEKERLDAELGLAKNIQESVIPRIFPPFPDRREIDLFALIHPAKEVGGDFYDFFFIDERRLAVVIADVSGKSVPAALFMMVAHALLRNAVISGMPPDEALFSVNNMLREDNKSSMFVTAFLAVLDVATGELTYANAGHNPSVILRHDGTAKWLPAKKAMPLGAMRGTRYQVRTETLGHKDTLVLYTDGVTEAFNPAEEMFSESRLLKVIDDKGNCHPMELLEHIYSEVERFALGAEQSDDIAMLALRWL